MEGIDLLIVEDNLMEAHLIKRVLLKENLTKAYYLAQDGEQVLGYLMETKNPLPKVIILDINIPKLDGFSVLKRLKADERTCKIPVVMYSSSFQHSDVEKAYTLGANSYLNKPAKLQEMKDLFTNICSYWLDFNKTA